MKGDPPTGSAVYTAPLARLRSLGWTEWAASALIGLFLVAAFLSARIKSATSDEPPHIAAGMSYWVTHEIFRANPEHPPLLKELAALSLMASGVRWPNSPEADYLANGSDPAKVFRLEWPVGLQILLKNGPDRVLLWARAPLILIGGLLGTALFLWGRRLFGATAALGSVLVFALDPLLFAHSQFVTTDVGEAAFGTLALFGLWTYLQRPTWKCVIWTALAFGAALTSKFSAVLLLPIGGALLLASQRWPLVKPAPPPVKPAKAAPRRRTTPLWLACLVILAGAFAVVQATYFFPDDVTMYLKCARMVYADNDPSYMRYMAGGVSPRFASYFAVAYLLKEPLAAIVLSAIGLIVLLRDRTLPVLTKWFLLLPPAVFFAAISIGAANHGARYLIPLLPFTCLLAGLGLATLFERGRNSRPLLAVAAVLCVWLAVEAVAVYPDQLSYFNEAACLLSDYRGVGPDGGTRCGTAWLDDSNVDWGQGFQQLKRWLDRNAPGRPVKFAYWTAFPAEAYGIPAERLSLDDLTRGPSPGLYVVSAHFVARGPALSPGAAWLRSTPPVAIVGHALYVYDVRKTGDTPMEAK